jgi:hypothetical protein
LTGAIAAALPSSQLVRVDRKLVIESVVRAAHKVGARLEGRSSS